MAPMGPIPGHVTGLYVFAVINLTLLLNITFTDANILVLDQHNRTINTIHRELEARFGPPLPDEGVWGHVVYTDPPHGCVNITRPPSTSSQWIALIKRRDCDFDVKVFNAQRAGFIAAIVFNDNSEDLVPMGGGKIAANITIPSVFIGKSDAEYLYDNFNKNTKFALLLDDNIPFNVQLYLVPFAIVVGICFVLMLVFMVVKWVRDLRKKQRSRLSKRNLNKIPVKKFKKGDDYDVCAICLDDYEEGDKLRILPCSHAYHQKCIDPWLTKNKKTCPICKRKVMPGREDESDSDSDSSSDDDDGGGGSETTPLLPAQDLRRNPLLNGPPLGGGTFESSGLPESVRSQLLLATDTSDDSDDSAAPSSFYQSSVEVHSIGPPLPPPPPTTSYTLTNETRPDDDDDDDEEAPFQVSEAREEASDEDEASGYSNLATRDLDIAEDHFHSEDALDPLGAVQRQNVEEEDVKEEEVAVVMPRNGRRKKKRTQRHGRNDEDA